MGKRQGWDNNNGWKSNKGMKAKGKEYKKHYQDGKVDKVIVRNRNQKHDAPHDIVERSGASHNTASKKGKRKGSREGYQDAGKAFWKVFFGK